MASTSACWSAHGQISSRSPQRISGGTEIAPLAVGTGDSNKPSRVAFHTLAGTLRHSVDTGFKQSRRYGLSDRALHELAHELTIEGVADLRDGAQQRRRTGLIADPVGGAD